MKFTCQNCGTSKTVKEKYAGRTVTCPECKSPVEIPALNGESDSKSATSVEPNPPQLPKRPVGQAPSRSNIATIREYSISRGKLGSSVAYPCPMCGQKLTSSLNDAGGTDHCPDCHCPFIVPGEMEYKQDSERRATEDAVRQAKKDERTEASKQAVVNRVAQKGLKNKNVQLNRDPLQEWSIYVGIGGLLLIVGLGRFIYSAVRYDESLLCIVIIALFLLGLFVNFRGILRLRNEYVCAAVCMIELNRVNGLSRVTKGPAAGILHQHIIDLASIAKYDDHFTQDSLVTLLYSRMMSKSKIVDILSGVLVTLGLIGTIVGLISMTDGLSVTLESLGADGAATELLSGMRSTMAGLGTAFGTTLVGAILGSVVLRILNNVYTSNVDHLITYVASTAEVSIVPRLKQEARSHAKAEEEVFG